MKKFNFEWFLVPAGVKQWVRGNTKDRLSGCCNYCWEYQKPDTWEFPPPDTCLEGNEEIIPKNPPNIHGNSFAIKKICASWYEEEHLTGSVLNISEVQIICLSSTHRFGSISVQGNLSMWFPLCVIILFALKHQQSTERSQTVLFTAGLRQHIFQNKFNQWVQHLQQWVLKVKGASITSFDLLTTILLHLLQMTGNHFLITVVFTKLLVNVNCRCFAAQVYHPSYSCLTR